MSLPLLRPKQFLPPCTCRHASSRHSPSSSNYLSRQSRDPYVRSAVASSYASRAAFKLIELNDRYRTGVGKGKAIVRSDMNIVDLGAAPGGWTQVCHGLMRDALERGRKGKGKGRIVALDLLPLKQDVASLEGVTFLQGDFEDPLILSRLLQLLSHNATSTATPNATPKVDLVLSDLLPNMTGTRSLDSSLSYTLNKSVLNFATRVLSRAPPTNLQPQLIVKHLTSDLTTKLRKELREKFEVVKWEKPMSSRKGSREGFWVCSGFLGDSHGGVRETEESIGSEDAKDAGGLYF